MAKRKIYSKYFVTSDETRLRYLITDGNRDNTWLILLHGLGGDAYSWEVEQQILLKQGISSVAVDLRGHGLSGRPQKLEAYTFERLSQDINELVAFLKIKSVVMVGHCLGGMVAINVVSKGGIPLKGLVLIDISYKASFFGLPSEVPRTMSRAIRAMAELVPNGRGRVHAPFTEEMTKSDINLLRFLADVKATSLRSYLACCSNAFDFDATEKLKDIKVPTLVMSGTEDSVFPPELSRDCAQRIQGAHFALVPGANHISLITKPEELVVEIGRFIKKL